jgi:hypothetical protein
MNPLETRVMMMMMGGSTGGWLRVGLRVSIDGWLVMALWVAAQMADN